MTENSSPISMAPIVGAAITVTCQSLQDQLTALENAEIFLKTADDVATAKLIVDQQNKIKTSSDLQQNLSQQLAIHGQMNAMGCPNPGTGS